MLLMFQSLIAHLDGKRAEEQHRSDERLAQEQRRAEERLEERLAQERRDMDERHTRLLQAVLAGNSGRPGRDADPAADRSRPSDERLRMSFIGSAAKAIEKFKGESDTTRAKVDNFLAAFERWADLAYLTDAEFIEHGCSNLVDNARRWYDNLSEKPTDRADFLKKFRLRWYPTSSALTAIAALKELRMNGTTAEFISQWRSGLADLEALVKAAVANKDGSAAMPSAVELLEWFKDGLRSQGTNRRAKQLYAEVRISIRALYVTTKKAATVYDALDYAEAADRDIPDAFNSPAEPSGSSSRRPSKRDVEVAAMAPRKDPSKSEGTRSNRIPAAPRDAPDSEVQCFNCGKLGHRIAACPSPKLERKAYVNAIGMDRHAYGLDDVIVNSAAPDVADTDSDAGADATAGDGPSDDDPDFPGRV
jgi:hypothetical protein